MLVQRKRLFLLTVALLGVSALTLGACGSSKKSNSSASGGGAAKPTTLALSISESGKTAKFTLPASTKGGLVSVTLKNTGKMPHSAQLVRLEGGHTVAQAVQNISGHSDKTPSWLRAAGGVAQVAPGQTGTAMLNLAAGKYGVVELGGPGSSGPPAHAELTVTPGQNGSLPATSTTVTGAAPSKDQYRWQVSGALKSGVNQVTFNSKGTSALHFIGAFRINGNHSKAEIVKGLSSNGPPPPFVDQSSFTTTAALDGGQSQTTELAFQKPGTYVLFCPLHDRDGGKPHFAEGMLTEVKVK